MMLVRFFGCCFKSNFSLLSWSGSISFDIDNCFSQCVAIVGSQFNFFIALKKLPTPNCLLNDKSSSHFSTRHLFHFLRQLQFGFDSLFTTESVKTLLSLFGLSSSFIDFPERHLTIGLLYEYEWLSNYIHSLWLHNLISLVKYWKC